MPSGAFGFQAALSVTADLAVTLTLPYVAMYLMHSVLFRCHLLCTREMWYLFRGEWRNKVRSCPR